MIELTEIEVDDVNGGFIRMAFEAFGITQMVMDMGRSYLSLNWSNTQVYGSSRAAATERL